MEYDLSPDEYSQQQLAAARRHEEQKIKESKKAIRPKKYTLFHLLFGNIHNYDDLYDDTFGSYMLTTCFEMGSIFAILCSIGLPICLAIFSATTIGGRIGMAIFGLIIGNLVGAPIGGLLIGYVYGGVFGILLFPLSYPLYAKVLIPLKAKKTKSFFDDIERYNRETVERIAKYQANFEPEAKRLSKNLENIDHTVEIAELVVKDFLYEIKKAQRASRIKTVHASYLFTVKREYVGKGKYSITFYNFSDHRIENISSAVKKKALAIAIVSLTEKILPEKYDKDESGTAYKISHVYSRDGSDVKVELNYSAPNGNYTPAQQW